MNITIQSRFSVILILTATVAIATASAAPDQTAAAQIDPTPIQRVALLNVPTARSQADIWSNPQPALASEPQVPYIENSTRDDGSLVLAVVRVHSRPTAIKYLALEAKKLVLGNHSADQH